MLDLVKHNRKDDKIKPSSLLREQHELIVMETEHTHVIVNTKAEERQ